MVKRLALLVFIVIVVLAPAGLVLAAPTVPDGAGNNPDAADHDDAFVAPDLGVMGNLNLAATSSITPGYYQTSEYMAGSAAVGIVLVQSNGSVDASTEQWTSDEKKLVLDKIMAATNWWAKLEPRAHLSFVFDDHASNPLPTGVEPISRPIADQQIWIADAMGALGYQAPSYFARVRDYDNDLRAKYHTDWAFTIFVVDSSNDSDGSFSEGYFAYAYLGGPFMVMTLKNGNYGPESMDAVVAHEIGHIFNALDQYSSAAQPCSARSGYLVVENQNSQYSGCASNVSSIMRGQVYPYTIHAIDPYAAGQIGWRDSDGDNILDPLDTGLPITITAVLTDGNRVTISGAAEIVPYPSPNRPSVAINTLTGVQYRVDQGDWQPAITDDGAFDGITESYHLTISLTPGLRTVEAAALDSAGNTSDIYARQTFAILDPVDGGLITELRQPQAAASDSRSVTIKGVAYDLSGSAVTHVQYRVNGGAWQPVAAQDGAFDSNTEPFALTFDSLPAGAYMVEAFAANANGKVEINLASQVFTITPTVYTAFLPAITR